MFFFLGSSSARSATLATARPSLLVVTSTDFLLKYEVILTLAPATGLAFLRPSVMSRTETQTSS